MTGWHDPKKDIDAKSTDEDYRQASRMDRTPLNVGIASNGADCMGGLLSIDGTPFDIRLPEPAPSS